MQRKNLTKFLLDLPTSITRNAVKMYIGLEFFKLVRARFESNYDKNFGLILSGIRLLQINFLNTKLFCFFYLLCADKMVLQNCIRPENIFEGATESMILSLKKQLNVTFGLFSDSFTTSN